jgi:pimeloyl-ACP methyl ester carboxylesterase
MATKIDARALLERAQQDRELAHRLRGFSGTVALPFLEPALDIAFDNGRTTAVAPSSGSATYVFEGPLDWWDRALAKGRESGFEQIVGGMSKGVRVGGITPVENAAYTGGFSRLFDVMKETLHGSDAVEIDEDLFKDTDTAVGRYVRVKANGHEARMYYEETGEGDVVLLLQHTAGGDSRQYRHQLADPELQKKFRLIAYDLPYHGRSNPPFGVRWWEENYRTSKEELMGWVLGLMEALGIEKPIFMGCSVGGNLALDLGANHPDKFRAVISLNGWYAPLPRHYSNDQFRDPILSQDHYASFCYAVTAPGGPETYRREIYWNYASGFHGVYAGDNDYFVAGHDLRKDGHGMRPDVCAVYVLVGEYDPSSRDAEYGGPAVAKNIPGTVYKEMKGLSHFAPTDDPLAFRKELFPVLDAILTR